MPSDPRALAARVAHARASELDTQADQQRGIRDQMVRALHGEGWSYSDLARAVFCSESLIALIVRNRTGRKAR